jgi:DNA repair protein RecO (recombination protein O)
MKLDAIVLHSIKYGEADLIIYLYTQQHGRQSCMLRGIHKTIAHRNTANVQPLFLLEIEALPPKKSSGMPVIHELKASPPLAGIAGSISKTAMALFISEILYRFIKEIEANPALYDFLQRHIIALDQMHEGIANFHLYFLAQLAHHLGFLPGNKYDSMRQPIFDLRTGHYVGKPPSHEQYLNAHASSLLWQLLHCPRENLHAINLSHIQRNILINGLLHYYSFHLGMQNPIRSLAILREIFA